VTKEEFYRVRAIPKNHVHRHAVEELPRLTEGYERLQPAISLLIGIKNDPEHGFWADLATAIEAEIASNYMAQTDRRFVRGHCAHRQ
jgi:hypothetical protein